MLSQADAVSAKEARQAQKAKLSAQQSRPLTSNYSSNQGIKSSVKASQVVTSGSGLGHGVNHASTGAMY